MTSWTNQLRILLLLVVALFAVGCAGVNNEPAAAIEPQTEAVVEVAEAPTVAPTEEPVPEATAVPAEEVAEPTEEPAEEPAESVADIGPPPAFTENLKATDPTKVVLGQGKPQLVEFFAFW